MSQTNTLTTHNIKRLERLIKKLEPEKDAHKARADNRENFATKGKATVDSLFILKKNIDDGKTDSVQDGIKTAKALLKVVDTIADLASLAGPQGAAAGQIIQLCTGIVGGVLTLQDEEKTSVEKGIEEIKAQIKQEFRTHRFITMVEEIDGQLSEIKSKIRTLTTDINRDVQEDYKEDKVTEYSAFMGRFDSFVRQHKNCTTVEDGDDFAEAVLRYAVFAEYLDMYYSRLKLSNWKYKAQCDNVAKDVYKAHETLVDGLGFYKIPDNSTNFIMSGFYKLGASKMEYIRVWLGREPRFKTVQGHIVNIFCGANALGCKPDKEDVKQGKDRHRLICKKAEDFSASEKMFVILGPAGSFIDYQDGPEIALSQSFRFSDISIFSVGGCGYVFASSIATDMPFFGLSSTVLDMSNNVARLGNLITEGEFGTNFGDIDYLKGVMVYAPGNTTGDSLWRVTRDENNPNLHSFRNLKHDLRLMAIAPGQVIWDSGDDSNYAYVSDDYQYPLEVLSAAEWKYNYGILKQVRNALPLPPPDFEPKENTHVEIIWSMKKL